MHVSAAGGKVLYDFVRNIKILGVCGFFFYKVLRGLEQALMQLCCVSESIELGVQGSNQCLRVENDIGEIDTPRMR